jgi:HK97 family phage major capsid protein
MLKSDAIKAELAELQEQIKALAAEGKPVDQATSDKLKSLYVDLGKAQAEEEMAKSNAKKPIGGNNMNRKELNNALRKFLLNGQTDEALKLFAAATGQNGANGSDGGVLIPEELLDLKENNVATVDLREIVTTIPVTTRSGSVPIIDYGQDISLVDFDENGTIAETKAIFKQAKFALKSKGAIIPVSRELLHDSNFDVVAIIEKLFNRVHIKDSNKSIVNTAITGGEEESVTAIASKEGIDAIKKAVNLIPLDAGANATIVMNQKTFAELANVSDEEGRYLLARDANDQTIRIIEGRPLKVVEADTMADNTVVVGDFAALYHIAYPDLEIASSEEAGFTRNSVLVRAITRAQDINTYTDAFKVIKQGA